jgi:hypothetical protein
MHFRVPITEAHVLPQALPNRGRLSEILGKPFCLYDSTPCSSGNSAGSDMQLVLYKPLQNEIRLASVVSINVKTIPTTLDDKPQGFVLPANHLEGSNSRSI